MNDIKKRIDEMILELKQEREELRVKLHLGKMEASEEWDKLGEKITKLEAKAKDIGASRMLRTASTNAIATWRSPSSTLFQKAGMSMTR